jgi:hypothetical protein
MNTEFITIQCIDNSVITLRVCDVSHLNQEPGDEYTTLVLYPDRVPTLDGSFYTQFNTFEKMNILAAKLNNRGSLLFNDFYPSAE